MPIKNEKIYCINHPDLLMKRLPGYYAITKLEKDGEKITFMPSSGIPVVVFTCGECGYLEFYPALKFKAWREGALYVKCKSCTKDFFSPIQMDKESFETSSLKNNSFQCPGCGKMNSYNKEDMFFK